jgi:hypothetical protein
MKHLKKIKSEVSKSTTKVQKQFGTLKRVALDTAEHLTKDVGKHLNNISQLTSPFIAQILEKTQISKYHTLGGHGFAAEDANNLSDKLLGKTANVVGTTNKLNGADRIVNGMYVQSKYFQSSHQTIAAAFDSNSGRYRYKGQLLEVPKDQYTDCVKLMRDRIEHGHVPGITNPADAEKIVQQGTVTYKQAKNIARVGNFDSLIFDAKTQAVTSMFGFTVSFAVTFAQSRWNGGTSKDATVAALGSAILGGCTTFVTGIMSAQLLRTKAAAFGSASVRSVMKIISGTSVGRAAVHRIATASVGKTVTGAAAVNYVSKLFRTNAVTAAIATFVTSTPDFYRAVFEHSISGQQFIKNLSVNAVGVASGTAGWIGGAAAGAAVGSAVPGLGTAVGGVTGGIIGSLGGSAGGTATAKFFADKITPDDSKILLEILQNEIEELAYEYMLTEDELESVMLKVEQRVTPKWLRRMFKKNNKRDFVRIELEYIFIAIIQERPNIVLPSIGQFEDAVDEIHLLELTY